MENQDLLKEIQKDYKTKGKKQPKAVVTKVKKKFRIEPPLTSLIIFILLAVIATAIYSLITTVNNFFDNNRLVKQEMITLKYPFRVEKKEKVIEVKADIPEGLTDIETLICKRWDIVDCKLALAIAHGEGLDDPKTDGWNNNTDGSIDVGIMRINSSHFDEPGCSLAEVSTVEGNINCAYSIWEKTGWESWVAYTNGSFRKHIK